MGADRLRRATIDRLRQRLGISGLEEAVGGHQRAYGADIKRVWELLDGHEERIDRIELQVRIATVMACRGHPPRTAPDRRASAAKPKPRVSDAPRT
jgi:hypothetical protein